MKRLLLFALIILALFALSSCSDEPASISVQYTALKGGYISGMPYQVKDAIDGVAKFNAVMAVPNNGYKFVSWSDGSTEARREDFLSASATFSATFALDRVTLKYECEGGGSIEGQATQYITPGGNGVSVTAIADEGFRFVSWDDGNKSPTRRDLGDTDKTFTAIFTNKASVTYESGEGGKINGEATQSVTIGDYSSTVTAVASEGYKFVSWSDGSTNPIRNDLITADGLSVQATFKKYYTVTFTCDPTMGKIAGEAVQQVVVGESSFAVVVREIEGYEFVCWSDGTTSKSMAITPTEDTTIYAHFMKKGYGLPTVFINTVTGKDVTSKKDYIACTISINDTEGDHNLIEATAQIRGRGNSTWTKFPKKPYKFKLDVSQNLFGFGKAKDWVLLADYIDNSLLRNCLAYKIAGEFSELEASPDCQSVEVYLNGEYRGVYLLCEQIEIDDDRVDITEIPDSVDTGYLIEMDQWALDGASTDIYVSVPDSLRSNRAYTIKAPDELEITDAHKEYIRAYIKSCIDALYADDYAKVCELIDVKSFAQAYIVYELTKNPDVDYSSFYMYKDAGGVMRCGPVWDFDMSLGNAEHKSYGKTYYQDPSSSNLEFYARDKNPWFKGLLRFDDFKALVATELAEYAPKIEKMIDDVTTYALSKSEAYKQNFEKWDVIGVNTWTNPTYIVEIDTWEEHVAYCKAYLEKSLTALKENYSNLD